MGDENNLYGNSGQSENVSGNASSRDYGRQAGYNGAPDYNTASGYNGSPDYNATSGYNGSPDYNATSGYNSASDFNTTSRLQEALRMGIMGSRPARGLGLLPWYVESLHW